MGLLGGKLEFPDCEECQLLDNLFLRRDLINKYHNDEIGITSLPKPIQTVLRRYHEFKGFNKVCPMGKDTLNDCENCNLGRLYHYSKGRCVERVLWSSLRQPLFEQRTQKHKHKEWKTMPNGLKVSIEGDEMVLRFPLERENPKPSASGKTLTLFSTRGYMWGDKTDVIPEDDIGINLTVSRRK